MNYVITIGRQFGSGGRSIGKYIAEKLNIPYYDSELITLAAEKFGLDSDVCKQNDEKSSKALVGLFSSIPSGYYYPMYNDMIKDTLFQAQAEIIREVAVKPCVIVGRCSDYILKDKPNVFKVFLYADVESRKKRLIERYGTTEKLEKLLAKADKQRANYYNYYTDWVWGQKENYDICISTSKLTAAEVGDIIIGICGKK
ncbi:MAG: cytidylate kinase-like family protein [Clostridia bacterium]|nr:cytidylate kinase-like family protein [Clostridia bacterium]